MLWPAMALEAASMAFMALVGAHGRLLHGQMGQMGLM